MDIKEKNEFLEVIKGKITEIAKAEATASVADIAKANKEAQDMIEKVLGDKISKADFDKMEGAFKKQLTELENKNTKELSFNGIFIEKHAKQIDEFKAMADGKLKSITMDIEKTPGVFTAVNSLGGASAAANFAINNNEMIVPIARRRTHIRNIIGMGTTDQSVFPYLRETPKEGAVGTQNPEGAAKAQVEYKASLVYATEETIAAFQLTGRQTLTNVRGLSTFLNMVMLKDLMIKEDGQLLAGTGADGQILGFTVGALTATNIPASFKKVTPTVYDAIAAAAATLSAREYTANFCIVNPLTYWDMLTLKDNDGRYQQNVIFDAQASILYVFGIPVIASTAVAAGEMVVGDSTHVMPMQREGITLRFSEEDGTNFQSNLVTARVEERILQAVLRSDAFFADTITDVTTAITPST